ncbi:RNA-binding domain-containing protein [Nocardiopsis dassonvillei]|uniref:AlbA family DNA-binding domain-containing protein n=1 Tax=Nocardiopsis dassonvillei TaxID=2014 RepID=UPI0033D47AEE
MHISGRGLFEHRYPSIRLRGFVSSEDLQGRQQYGHKVEIPLGGEGIGSRVFHMTTSEEIERHLEQGYERRSFEVKGPGLRTDKHYLAKVVRAVMAMGNLRDGGLICLGVDDNRIAEMQPGLDPQHLAQWSNYDDVSAAFSAYSDPPVAFDLHRLRLSNGVEVVVIAVREFEREPHVCKRGYQDALKQGHTYVRPRGKPESVPVPSSVEMRELLELAIDKGVREFMRRAGAVGVPLGGGGVVEQLDDARFTEERRLAWERSSPVTNPAPGSTRGGITSPAFTDVAVRPGPYREERLRPEQLEPFLIEHVVRLRGWPVPFIDSRQPLLRHGAWIGQDVQSSMVPHAEAWRVFTSGHFLHRRVLATDLRDSPTFAPTWSGATGTVTVRDVLLYMVEVAEFAARWSTTLVCETITFEVALDNVGGRELISGDSRRELHGPYTVTANRLETSIPIEVPRLLTTPRQVGVELAQKLLRHFGLNVPGQVLFDYQEQVFTS